MIRAVSRSAIVLAIALGCTQQLKSQSPTFLYVANGRTGSVSAYAINASSGALTLVPGSPFSTEKQPADLAVDPSEKFAYVLNRPEHGGSGSDLSVYTINANSGALKPVQGSPFAVGIATSAAAIAVNNSGKFVYVLDFEYDGSSVYAYTVDATTGALKPVPGSPFATGTTAGDMALDPTGKFMYLLTRTENDVDNNKLSVFSIDATTGALTRVQGSPFTAGTMAVAMAVDSGKFLYIAGGVADDKYKISAYGIDASTGALTPAASTVVSSVYGPTSIAVDPAGRFAYVSNTDAGKVSAYRINADNGALEPVSGAPIAAGYHPGEVQVDPSGKFVYVMNNDSRTISAYAINATTGALTQVAGSPFQNPAAVLSDPFAGWFTGGDCEAMNHLSRAKQPDGTVEDRYDITHLPSSMKVPRVQHDEDLKVTYKRLNIETTPWFYLYDPRAGVAYRHTGGDSDITYTLRFAGKPPPGVPQTDLSVQTTSGLKLGSSAASVVAALGEPYITRECGVERYDYLRWHVGPDDLLEFTIRNGRVVEIFATFYG